MQQYTLQRRIGSGGMGLVFEGRKLTQVADDESRPVAVKLIPPRTLPEEEQQAVMLFEREAVMSWRFTHEHPNLVTTYDYGISSKGCRYLVMELIDGETLRDLTKDRRRLPNDVILRIARDALQGIGHLHKRQILHRDVTPRNIMVSKAGEVKVADFGLAKDAHRSGSQYGRGTPAYSSPEALQAKALGPSSDLYSLGIVLYELVTGNRPYGRTTEDVMFAVLEEKQAEPLPEVTPNDLVELIEGLIPLRPVERRWRFASDVIEFIDGCDMHLATDSMIADVVEQRASKRDIEKKSNESLPKVGWPFEAFADPEPVRGSEKNSSPGVQASHQAERRGLRWLPWMLVPLAFVAGLLVFALVGGTAPRQQAKTQGITSNDDAITSTKPTTPNSRADRTEQRVADGDAMASETREIVQQQSSDGTVTSSHHVPASSENTTTPSAPASMQKRRKVQESKYIRRSYRSFGQSRPAP